MAKQAFTQTATQLLGLIPWRRRALAQKNSIALLLVTPPDAISHPVLAAILKSLSTHSVHALPANNTLEKEIDQLNPAQILVFGNEIKINTDIPLTQTHSLNDLAQNPACKRETFNQLKTMGFYS